MRILFVNLGYARGITGKLSEHIRFAHRHIYCSPHVQKKSLLQLKALIDHEKPDLCCFVEIDQKSLGSASFNQINFLKSETYAFSDIENKYGRESILRSFVLTSGKSNAFISSKKFEFETLYFSQGVKRLIYKIKIEKNRTLYFAHFSLNKKVRQVQIMEARDLMRHTPDNVIFLGDFNILSGLQEITPLLDGGRFVLLNRHDDPTFFFHNKAAVLDLCICSKEMATHAHLDIKIQAYTDHAALILDLK